MQWKLNIGKKYEQTKVTIQAPELTEDITRLTTFIDQLSHTLTVKKDGEQNKIDIMHIIYIENIERMTFIYTETNMYEDNRPLYELEKNLRKFDFIRINKQTIISPRFIKSVKALLNSRYELMMTSGEKVIVTRHYRKAFKKLFEQGGLYDA